MREVNLEEEFDRAGAVGRRLALDKVAGLALGRVRPDRAHVSRGEGFD